MKRIIYKPEVGETIPDGAIQYEMPVNGFVVDVIVPEDFTTNGVILYDSANAIELTEPFIHHFSGWEV